MAQIEYNILDSTWLEILEAFGLEDYIVTIGGQYAVPASAYNNIYDQIVAGLEEQGDWDSPYWDIIDGGMQLWIWSTERGIWINGV